MLLGSYCLQGDEARAGKRESLASLYFERQLGMCIYWM